MAQKGQKHQKMASRVAFLAKVFYLVALPKRKPEK
jgi:hypothetical protein